VNHDFFLGVEHITNLYTNRISGHFQKDGQGLPICPLPEMLENLVIFFNLAKHACCLKAAIQMFPRKVHQLQSDKETTIFYWIRGMQVNHFLFMVVPQILAQCVHKSYLSLLTLVAKDLKKTGKKVYLGGSHVALEVCNAQTIK